MEFDIQFAAIKDCAAISQLAGASFHLACPEDCDKKELKTYIEEHLTENAFVAILESESIIVIARSGSLLVGMMVLEPLERSIVELDFAPGMLIRKLYISSDYHGAGVADQLMCKMEELNKKYGLHQAWLTVFSGNKRAIRFYQKKGFENIGNIEFYMGKEIHLDNLMAKKFNW
ncbi:MAG: hypothetical protein COA86_00135 [Kangiella sp.]|nr:MAG: hypothetical protein COA86_00135 [Kangiella sp.]